ncbi:MAG: cell division protein FtsQ, partial [Bacteroidaceae bacterium]
PEKNIELVPRIGEHIVFMGKLDHFEDKLARLELFYKKALNQVGWNKYERINIEFSNQIICTKKNN